MLTACLALFGRKNTQLPIQRRKYIAALLTHQRNLLIVMLVNSFGKEIYASFTGNAQMKNFWKSQYRRNISSKFYQEPAYEHSEA